MLNRLTTHQPPAYSPGKYTASTYNRFGSSCASSTTYSFRSFSTNSTTSPAGGVTDAAGGGTTTALGRCHSHGFRCTLCGVFVPAAIRRAFRRRANVRLIGRRAGLFFGGGRRPTGGETTAAGRWYRIGAWCTISVGCSMIRLVCVASTRMSLGR